ncbi:MAG: acyl transferase, partial [Bacteroidetes bacterium]|nr:acyl transferase [Bacteroidota bacterium]
FKSHRVMSGHQPARLEFRSSGTTGSATSTHYIYDTTVYHQSIISGFEHVFGPASGYTFLALLPSYLERSDSSLVYMMQVLMDQSRKEMNGFYMHNREELLTVLENLSLSGEKVWLIGVSYALLDFSEFTPPVWDGLTVTETGGMKGRRREMVREELHACIKQNWKLPRIESEYGMTELLSQGWTGKQGYFQTPPWMKILIRDSEDPFSLVSEGVAGGINILDLANLDSCSFISTSDLGKIHPGGNFEVLGRFDNSDVRGCNLLAEL